MTPSYPIRAIEPDEFAEFCAVPGQAFNSSYPPAEAQELDLITFEFDRSAAAFDGDQIVGTANAFTFQLSVPGGQAACGGVSFVAVLPTHRRRGIMSAMLRHLLADIAARGEPVAALFASEPEIYGLFGFGCATEDLRLTIPRGDGRLIPPAPGGGAPRLRTADPEQVRDGLGAVYAAVAARRPGLMARDDRWWQSRMADPQWARDGSTPVRWVVAEDDSGMRGYASYSVRPQWSPDGIPASQLRVGELMAVDPEATAALWTDLLTRDLVGEVRAPQRPVDDELLVMLAGRRRARASLVDGLWVRLIDVPAALSQRQYAREVDVVIEVTDDLLPANSGRWRLRADASGKGTCESSNKGADLVAPVQTLGAAYLGGARLGQLAAAGRLVEQRPGALAELSAAMTWDPAPWAPMIF
ncbi:MAG TPA: GNAT family N-acetyltransferase [Streptosporangiaceae bacterium]|nr:GNAT family N-acetyltransferase [Streptosporangiaceae bacterium]